MSDKTSNPSYSCTEPVIYDARLIPERHCSDASDRNCARYIPGKGLLVLRSRLCRNITDDYLGKCPRHKFLSAIGIQDTDVDLPAEAAELDPEVLKC